MEILYYFILGYACGMLVNYLSDVLPARRRLAQPLCIHCGHEMGSVNYFFWPRRCDQCGKRRDIWTWVVEVSFAIIVAWLWQTAPEKLGFWGSLILLVFFGVVVVIDMRYRAILEPVSIFGAVLGLAVGSYLHGIPAALGGGALGYGIMFLLYKLGEVFVRLMNKRRSEPVDDVALGFGDVNLSGVLGLVLGFPGIVVGLVLGALLGGAISLIYLIVRLLQGKYRSMDALPYGPFLIAGAVLLLFFPGFLLSIFK